MIQRNRLTEYTKGGVATPFTYDKAGNLLKDNKAEYTYDAFNRTEKVETFDGHVQINRYDAEGLRHELEEDGKLVQFIFRGDEAATEEKDSNIIRFIRGYDLIASDAENARTYYHYASDEMSKITHVVEGTDVLNRYEYDAWGNTTVCEEAVENRFRFNGQQYDPVTQQYYLRARFYNPVIARFTQEDTYRGDGLNLYAYCENNPVYYEDPSGHNPDCVTKKANTYMKQGMSPEEAYRKAYSEHAQDKLKDVGSLSPQERYKLEQRQNRLNSSANNNSNSTNSLYLGMDYNDARAAGLTASQARALATGNNPLVCPNGAGAYSVVKGHHVLQKAGFRGDPNYDMNAAFCLSEELMQSKGINHNNNSQPPSVSLAQHALFNDLANRGVPNTMAEHQRIAQESLIRGGASRGFAIDMANYAVVDMYKNGIVAPTRIPWN